MSNTVSGIKNMGAPDPIRQPVVMPSKKKENTSMQGHAPNNMRLHRNRK